MTAGECENGTFVGLLALFREQVQRHALEPAVVDAADSVTYDELDRASDLVARSLVARGAGPGGLVAVSMRSSVSLIVALLGILKSGAGYVPVSRDDPDERRAAIIESSQVRLIVVDEEDLSADEMTTLPAVQFSKLARGGPGVLRPPGGASDGRAEPSSGDTAYVIFTSGSTGRPKGVVIDHGALAAYLHVASSEYRALAGRTLLHSSISFDMSVTSLFGPLVCGGTIEIGRLLDLAAGGRPPYTGRPTFLKITPSHLPLLEALPASFSPSELLVIGGEALHWEPLRRWWRKHPDVAVINEYGPTEATVGCCIHRVEPHATHSGSLPIGLPTDGTRLHVLDGELREVPDGSAGELYIAGAQVARGYLHDARMSSERFLPDPFQGDGSRMYKTGDLVRREPSGILEFLGREDNQVKIDGHRVDLGEVEAALLRFDAIVQAAVLALETKAGSKRLSAFVRLAPGASLDAAAMRKDLETIIPSHMMPSQIDAISEFALTANGKIDRARLTAFSEVFGEEERQADDTRELMCRLVSEVTGASSVRIDDDFLELGGSSVGAAQLVNLARQAGIDIGLTDVLRHRTVRAVLEQLDTTKDHLEKGIR